MTFAWILQRWRKWTQNVRLRGRLRQYFIPTNATMYWVTESMAPQSLLPQRPTLALAALPTNRTPSIEAPAGFSRSWPATPTPPGATVATTRGRLCLRNEAPTATGFNRSYGQGARPRRALRTLG